MKASVSAAVAKTVGLKAGKRAKPIGVGSGSAQVAGGKLAVVKVKLTAKARTAIGAATKPVPIALAVDRQRRGQRSRRPCSRKLKIKRPYGQSPAAALALESPDFESEDFDSDDFESEPESDDFDSPPSEEPLPPPSRCRGRRPSSCRSRCCGSPSP